MVPSCCITCDPRLWSAILQDDFGWRLLGIPVPLVLGSLIAAWVMARAARRWSHPGPDAASQTWACTLIGLGLGGFIDGILLHQTLQWHQMITSVVPADSVLTKNINMFWDGLFHLATWTVTVIGILSLARLVEHRDRWRSPWIMWGAFLLGWGVFNLMDSALNHYLFGYHDVNENSDQPWLWNLGFLLLGTLQAGIGGWAVRHGARQARGHATNASARSAPGRPG